MLQHGDAVVERETSRALKVGDVVAVPETNRAVTVGCVDGSRVWCQWFEGGDLRTGAFALEDLLLISS